MSDLYGHLRSFILVVQQNSIIYIRNITNEKFEMSPKLYFCTLTMFLIAKVNPSWSVLTYLAIKCILLLWSRQEVPTVKYVAHPAIYHLTTRKHNIWPKVKIWSILKNLDTSAGIHGQFVIKLEGFSICTFLFPYLISVLYLHCIHILLRAVGGG